MTPILISLAVAAILLAIAVLEAKTGRIANWLIAVLLVAFAAKAVVFPDQVNVIWQVAFAFAVLAAGFGLFVAGAFGAGAAKLSAAVALFLPLDRLGTLGLIMLAAVILGILVFGLLRSAFGAEDSDWKSMQSRIVPMSFPIGVTALCGLFLV